MVARPCLVQRLMITGGCGWLMRCLAAETWVVPGLVPAHWWAVRVSKPLGLLPTCWQVKPDPGVSARLLAGRPGSRVWLQGPGVPELSQITGMQGSPNPHVR